MTGMALRMTGMALRVIGMGSRSIREGRLALSGFTYRAKKERAHD
jgi:hypothetical protein